MLFMYDPYIYIVVYESYTMMYELYVNFCQKWL